MGESNPHNQWLTVTPMHLARVFRNTKLYKCTIGKLNPGTIPNTDKTPTIKNMIKTTWTICPTGDGRGSIRTNHQTKPMTINQTIKLINSDIYLSFIKQNSDLVWQSQSFLERVWRVELRDLQIGNLLCAPCTVYPHNYNTISKHSVNILILSRFYVVPETTIRLELCV